MADKVEQRQAETTLRDFLNVIFRRKWVIVGVVGFATFLVFFLNARRPELFESSSKILLMRGEQTSVLSGHIRYLGWAEEVSSHIEIILSEEVFERAALMFADSVETNNYPEHWRFNPGGVRADVVGESNAFVIRYMDLVPDVCELGCETVTLAFQEFYRESKAPPELTDFFAEEIHDVRSELESWRDRREEFLDSSDYFGTSETSSFHLQKITYLEGELMEVEALISAQQIRVSKLEALHNSSAETLERELAFSARGLPLQSGLIQKTTSSLQNYRMLREELLAKYTDKHPDVVAVNEQITILREDLKRQIDNMYQIEAEDLAALENRRSAILPELAEARDGLDVIPETERQLNEMDAMISRLEKRHELLLNRQSESEIALAGRPEWEVTILSHAGAPINKKTSDYVRLALGPFLAVIVALGIAFFLESTDHTLGNSAEAEEFLNVPVLATVSEMAPEHNKRTRKTA